MKFELPGIKHKDKAMDFVKEFQEYSSQLQGEGRLLEYLEVSTYSKWLEALKTEADIANKTEQHLPSMTYFYVREEDEKIVGTINIRLRKADFLHRESSHIGYSIRPLERGKGYATQMLSRALDFCRPILGDKIILCCDKANTASARVIVKCGGVMTEEYYSHKYKEMIQRYII